MSGKSSFVHVSSMPSLYSSSSGSMTSGPSRSMTGTPGSKYTYAHKQKEHENLQAIFNQIMENYDSNIARFQGNEDDQARLFNDISQINLKYQGMPSDEIPTKTYMESEKSQNKKDLNAYKEICAEVEDFVQDLFFALGRLKHAPNPMHRGDDILIAERQRLHDEADAMYKTAKLEYYNPAKALCDKMYKTNENLEAQVLIHKQIYKDHHGEYLLTKGAKVISESLTSYFWKKSATQTPVKTTPPQEQTPVPQQGQTPIPTQVQTTTPLEVPTTAPQQGQTPIPTQVQTTTPLEVPTTAPQQGQTTTPSSEDIPITPSSEDIPTTPSSEDIPTTPLSEQTSTPVGTFPTRTQASTDASQKRPMSPSPSISSSDISSKGSIGGPSSNKPSYSGALTGLNNRIQRGNPPSNTYQVKITNTLGSGPIRPIHRKENSVTSEVPKQKKVKDKDGFEVFEV